MMARKLRPKEMKTKTASYRVTPRFHAALKRAAEADRRCVSQWIDLELENVLKAKGFWNKRDLSP
jgi:predicted HicB family RNase H-like nuclease